MIYMSLKYYCNRGQQRWAPLVMSVIIIVIIAAAVGFLTTRQKTPTKTSEEVVAEIDGQVLYAQEVRMHMEPAEPWVGSAPPSEPSQKALNEAIRVRLFAREAKDRGLKPEEGSSEIAQASLVQALIHRELQRQGIRAETITNKAAKRYYDENSIRFDENASVSLAAVVVEDFRVAKQLIRRAEGGTKDQFVKLVQKYSVDDKSKAEDGFLAIVPQDEDKIYDEVVEVGMALSEVGQVGLARGSDNRYYVLRATHIESQAEPWGGELIFRVKNVMAEERKQKALEELEEKLRQDSQIVVYADILDQI